MYQEKHRTSDLVHTALKTSSHCQDAMCHSIFHEQHKAGNVGMFKLSPVCFLVISLFIMSRVLLSNQRRMTKKQFEAFKYLDITNAVYYNA